MSKPQHISEFVKLPLPKDHKWARHSSHV